MTSLKKNLRKFRNYDELKTLASRLFQKDHQVTQNLLNLTTNGSTDTAGANELRHFILKNIERVIENGSTTLPPRMENYVSFSDLSFVVQHSSRKLWHTYLLQDYDPEVHDVDEENGAGHENRLSVFKLRKQIKKHLCKTVKNCAASVQLEFRMTDHEFIDDPSDEEDGDEVIFIRLCYVANVTPKNVEKVEKRLCSKKATFVAYFPGEPYLYFDTNRPDPVYIQAIVSSLFCSGYTKLPLCGRHVESLRKMRQLRDKQKEKSDGPDTDDNDNEVIFTTGPKLETLTVEAVSRDDKIVTNIRGQNILQGLPSFQAAKIFSFPPPTWATQAGKRGRNTLKIVSRTTERLDEHQPRPDQDEDDNDDAMSLAETELTAF